MNINSAETTDLRIAEKIIWTEKICSKFATARNLENSNVYLKGLFLLNLHFQRSADADADVDADADDINDENDRDVDNDSDNNNYKDENIGDINPQYLTTVDLFKG